MDGEVEEVWDVVVFLEVVIYCLLVEYIYPAVCLL